MSYCDYDGPSFFREAKQRARKPHLCDECGTIIRVGELYWKSTGKWDGEVQAFPQHQWCRAACTQMSKHSGDGCISFGSLFEEWHEAGYSEYSRGKEHFKKLRTYMAKVKIERRRRAAESKALREQRKLERHAKAMLEVSA